MDLSGNQDHLAPYWTSLRTDLLEKAGALIKMKVEAAQTQHADLLSQYRRLEEEATAADNLHSKEYFENLMRHMKPRIQHAYDTILPYIRR